MIVFNITEDMKKYISLQRTGYGDVPVDRCYYKDILKDYESIKPYLPENGRRCMDIGCGVGGIDVFLYRHYAENIELNMLDFSTTDEEIYYGYRERGSIYNNLDITSEFLQINGVNPVNFSIFFASEPFPPKKYDIIISLLSCGFHYPIETYLQQIKKCKAGIVILDVRHGTGQREILEDNFNQVETIAEWRKCERLLIK